MISQPEKIQCDAHQPTVTVDGKLIPLIDHLQSLQYNYITLEIYRRSSQYSSSFKITTDEINQTYTNPKQYITNLYHHIYNQSNQWIFVKDRQIPISEITSIRWIIK